MQGRDSERVLRILRNNTLFSHLVYDRANKQWFERNEEWSNNMMEVVIGCSSDMKRFENYKRYSCPSEQYSTSKAKKEDISNVEESYNIVIIMLATLDSSDTEFEELVIQGGTLTDIANILISNAPLVISKRILITAKDLVYLSLKDITAQVPFLVILLLLLLQLLPN
jgi:hypothetical protein